MKNQELKAERRGHQAIFDYLETKQIPFEYYEHPPLPTAEEAMKYRQKVSGVHCKNLFFRNHKGNKHYLVVFEHSKQVPIREIEQRLKQGKLSFASAKRLEKYLNVIQGSVSPLGLIYDTDQHVHLFLEEELRTAEKITFHPNDNTATLVFNNTDFMRFIKEVGVSYEFLELF